MRSVLDVGAGKGYWGDVAGRAPPADRATTAIDASAYACRRYGHELADLATWEPSRRYDLVVCQSVLQYLDRPRRRSGRSTCSAGRAPGLLFVEVPTLADRDDGDRSRPASDLDVHWRTGRWYRSRLVRHFIEVGAGLWLSRAAARATVRARARPLTASVHARSGVGPSVLVASGQLNRAVAIRPGGRPGQAPAEADDGGEAAHRAA